MTWLAHEGRSCWWLMDAMIGYSCRKRLAALTNSGSQLGSQRGPAPGDARPCPATEAAGERHTGPRAATCGDSWSVHGMQEVRSSSLRSSTFRRSEAICADLDRLLIVQEVSLSGELA